MASSIHFCAAKSFNDAMYSCVYKYLCKGHFKVCECNKNYKKQLISISLHNITFLAGAMSTPSGSITGVAATTEATGQGRK